MKKGTRNIVLMVIFLIVFIAFLWLTRYPKNYVYMFIGNYNGTEEVISGMNGETLSDEEKAEVLPYEQLFDDWKEQNLADDMQVETEDEVSLYGKLYDQGSDTTVIYLHTIAESCEGDFLYAPYYWGEGCNIFMPDNRAHGESEGAFASYGYYEKEDLKLWITELCKLYGNDTNIIIHGETMGASVALMASVELPSNVKFIVAENAIDNLYNAGDYLMSEEYNLPGFIMGIGDYYAKKLMGVSMKEVDSVSAVADNNIPLLFINGAADKIVDPANAQKIVDATSADTQIITVAGAAHKMAYAKDSKEIEDAVTTFIGKYVH